MQAVRSHRGCLAFLVPSSPPLVVAAVYAAPPLGMSCACQEVRRLQALDGGVTSSGCARIWTAGGAGSTDPVTLKLWRALGSG